MSLPSVRARAGLGLLVLSSAAAPSLLSCSAPIEQTTDARQRTWAELRTVRRSITVKPPEESERAPYPRERLLDGEQVTVAEGGLGWLRRDGGATLLVRGPAKLTVRKDVIELGEGRVFVDTPPGVVAELATPSGPLHLSQVRASVEVSAGATEAYVLAGEVRSDGAGRAAAGERLVVRGKAGAAKAERAPALTWEDWTGGLATTDRAAEPSPFGVGTVGARRPGDQGSPRFALSIQRLDVKVTIDNDLALTEVDELFFNPSSEVVEGVYRFRTPEGATMDRFGVDREGVIVWGRVKEKQAAAAQYQSNVYQGSTEDPALLEWDAPGVYRARLYPIGPGESRRVVVRYAEWLGRSGPKGERRLYVYPMAAEGAEASLPHIEELTATFDLSRSLAKDIRAGMAGSRDGDRWIVREHDLVPRADLAVELFDDGQASPRAYTAPHVVDPETLFPADRAEAQKRAREEAEYLLVPVRAAEVPLLQGGLDLGVIVDTSAATDTASLAIARAATAALLAHAGKDDRVVVWAGDAGLRPVVPGEAGLKALTKEGREAILGRLSSIERGGATDLGAMIAAGAGALDPKRRGALVYIGDGSPTVGELNLASLRERLGKLPRPVRVFSLGVGEGADMAILKGLSRGAFAERISDANSAARAALRLYEAAERPAWMGASVDLGPNVERIYPRDPGALVEGETMLFLGRVGTGPKPVSITLGGPNGPVTLPLRIGAIDDHGDLRRRWAEGRLAQMLDEGTGRAAMVDLGARHGIITPVTSLYVPTTREMSPEEREELARRKLGGDGRWKTANKTTTDGEGEPEEQRGPDRWGSKDSSVAAASNADNKEGGTGTRAKGEEGSMGNPMSRSAGNRYGVAGPASPPAQAAPPPSDIPEPLKELSPKAFTYDARKADAPAPSAAASAATIIPALPAATATTERTAEAKLEQKIAPDGKPGAPMGAPPKPGKSAKGGEIDGYRHEGDSMSGEVDLLKSNGAGWGRDDGADQGLEASGFALGGVGGQGFGNGQGFGSGHGRLGGSHRAPAGEPTPDTAENNVNAKEKPKAPVSGFRTSIAVNLGDVPHVALRCGSSAFMPFDERVGLWKERLARVAGNAPGVANVYRRALQSCEATTWQERSKLLSLLLDFMPGARGRVSLWRLLFNDLGAADPLYRGILARVKTPAEARELHDALGLRSIDPGVLDKLLEGAKTPGERAKKLRALVAEWPDDFSLALRLLDALEDAGDDEGARDLGRTLRARPDADARLRTAVGELHLRLAKKGGDAEKKALDEQEARRAFGEIVEFAPEDPVARRRLGDLLRAHGWFADAARQYETLAHLAPDDAAVYLLMASAAEGLGKLEEAVKWTEKGGAAGSPDAESGPARTARALAATFLAWGRKAALDGGKAEEAKALSARLRRVLASEHGASDMSRGVRVTLMWAHPELHPTLWSNALGAPMPAPDGDMALGVAQAVLPRREGTFVEVRIAPEDREHAARIGATARLTAIFDEGGEGETIAVADVVFRREGAATLRFAVQGGELREVQK
ncbi:MAG: VIT domain-containing protein [Byssovorax sp.]